MSARELAALLYCVLARSALLKRCVSAWVNALASIMTHI